MQRKKTIVVGIMDALKDHTFECTNRVYGKNGCCPAITTCGGRPSTKGDKTMGKIKRIGLVGIGECNAGLPKRNDERCCKGNKSE